MVVCRAICSCELFPWHIDSTEDNDAEEGTETSKRAILLFEERDGTLRIIIFKLDLRFDSESKRRVCL